MGYAETARRAIRHFNVYKGERLVLSVEDTPGQLFSVASPPPGGAPQHPFVNARAYDPPSEGQLADLVWNAADFDDFISQLMDSGLNIASWNDSSVEHRLQSHRVFRGDDLVGALWAGAGQFSTLSHQPPYDTYLFDHALVTAYADHEADSLLDCLQRTSTFNGLKELLREAGYSLSAVAPYHP